MSIQENDNNLFNNSIKYLHNISTLPQMNNPTLKSSLCLKRTLMGLRKNIHLPSYATKPKMHCQRCFLNFYDGPATYKIKSKPKQYKFAEKMLAKQKNGLPLTNYQKKYLKKNEKFSGNSLVVTCHFCQKETCTKLENPEIKSKPKVINTNSAHRKKKKNKKRDKLCGLNENVIISMNNSNDSKKVNKKIQQNLFSNPSNTLPQTTINEYLDLTSIKISRNTSESSNVETKITKKKSNKRPLEVITVDSDDSIQEVPSKRKFKTKKKPEPVIETSTPIVTPKERKKIEKNRIKLSTLIKKPKNIDTSSDFMQLLQVSKNNSSEVISLDSDDSVQEVPIRTEAVKKMHQVIQTSTPLIKTKKVKKNKNKLSKITNDSGKKKKSSNLVKFLQSF